MKFQSRFVLPLTSIACREPGVGKSSIINALRFNALTAQQGLNPRNPTTQAHSHASDEEEAQRLAERLGSHAEASSSSGNDARREQAGDGMDVLDEISAPWQGGLSLENVSEAASRSPEGMQVCTDLQTSKT